MMHTLVHSRITISRVLSTLYYTMPHGRSKQKRKENVGQCRNCLGVNTLKDNEWKGRDGTGREGPAFANSSEAVCSFEQGERVKRDARKGTRWAAHIMEEKKLAQGFSAVSGMVLRNCPTQGASE